MLLRCFSRGVWTLNTRWHGRPQGPGFDPCPEHLGFFTVASIIPTPRWGYGPVVSGGFTSGPGIHLHVEKPLKILAGAKGQYKDQGRRRSYRVAEAVTENAAIPAKAYAQTLRQPVLVVWL